jgi:GxxExxY protein
MNSNPDRETGSFKTQWPRPQSRDRHVILVDMSPQGISIVHASETEAIIGAFFEVINTLGHGFLEKPYENALCVELSLRGIPFVQQPRFPINYKSVLVGEYIPDLIAFDRVVVDAKTIDRITDHELGQMLNYLRITSLPIGLIINFKRSRLEWKRVIL